MKRRQFVAGLVAICGVARPIRAQQTGKIYRIGILESIPAAANAPNLDGLRRGLRDAGYIEGQNLAIEYRSADGRPEQFPDLAAELVRLKVDLIVTRGTPATRAAKEATETIPMVMATMGDPSALVSSFARPGGNVTGVITFSTELTAKRIEILKELAPGLSRVALLHNMGNPAVPPEWEETKAAANSLGLQAVLLDVRSAEDLDHALKSMVVAHRADALVVGFDGLTQMHRQRIVEAAARDALPAVYPGREFVEVGGLIAYTISYPDLYYRFANFIDRIFKGAKPSELPVEQPSRFELIVNLRTARALNLTVPPDLLTRADEVLE